MRNAHLLGPFVRRFLLEEVVADRNLSVNTQRSYRDAIRLLFTFMSNRHATDPTRVTVEQLTAGVVRGFLAHLEDERRNSVTTRNLRLAAIHALFRFIASQVPELVEQATEIRAIPPRHTSTASVGYLDKNEIDAVLAIPDRGRPQGARDYALLLFLYNTGARASEVATLTLGDLALSSPASARLRGKGRKTRICPLWEHTADVLGTLVGRRIEGPPTARAFLNVRGQPMTRFGIRSLVVRTVEKAVASAPTLRTKHISPHTIRHTSAVHLLRAGVDINTIRAWLGHVSLDTTNQYAEVDLEMKAKALETCAIRPGEELDRTPLWRENEGIMAFLLSL